MALSTTLSSHDRSVEKERNFDTQLFTLALLLSSLFMLNTQGTCILLSEIGHFSLSVDCAFEQCFAYLTGTINEQSLELLELVIQCTYSSRRGPLTCLIFSVYFHLKMGSWCFRFTKNSFE